MASWELRYITHESSDHEKAEVTKFWNGLYTWMTESRLEAPWDDETYGIAAAFDGDTCISTTSYTVSARGQGILSQVHTDENHRKQGIGGRVIDAALDAFKKNGAHAVYLASWDQWIRNNYMKRGFVNVGNMGKRGAFKLTVTPDGEDDVLFRPNQKTVIRSMSAGDQGDITSLFCAEHPLVVKHYELGCYLGSYFEGEFYVLRNQKVEGLIPEERKDKEGFRALVLDGEETILGLGTVIPSSRRHEIHTGVVDVLVHPSYQDQAHTLLDRLLDGCELGCLTACIEKGENAKRELFANAGFVKATDLNGQLKIDDATFDLEMWRKELS